MQAIWHTSKASDATYMRQAHHHQVLHFCGQVSIIPVGQGSMNRCAGATTSTNCANQGGVRGVPAALRSVLCAVCSVLCALCSMGDQAARFCWSPVCMPPPADDKRLQTNLVCPCVLCCDQAVIRYLPGRLVTQVCKRACYPAL